MGPSFRQEVPFRETEPAGTIVIRKEEPALYLVRPAVNVAGKSTIKLSNPNGWYCFRSNVTVAGAMHIDAHCKAHIASAREDGTSVGAVDQSGSGVAVFGAVRVNRFDC